MGISVKIKNLHKAFGEKCVLDGVNIDIGAEESFVILGKSGCGKSVLLKNIAKLINPDTGQIFLNEINIKNIRPYAYPVKKIGILFQEIGLFDFINIWENVAFHYIEVLNYSKKDAKKLAIKHLEEVGITEASANLIPSQASLGMQKRIGLARILASQPELILLDEPTSGLDTISSAKIGKIALKKIRGTKATAITITHDLKLASYMGDRIGLMHEGRFIWTGTPQEFESTTNKTVRNFIEGIGEDIGALNVKQ